MGKSSKSSRRTLRSKKRTVRRRAVGRRSAPVSRSTPIDYIVKGARTLIGLLPGQAILKPISDFIFGNTKVTQATYFDCLHQAGILDAEKTSTIGLQVSINISPTTMITDTPSIVTSQGGAVWYSNYTHCCLRNVQVTVISTCPTAKKSGMWALCLTPLSDTQVMKPMTYRHITEAPFSKCGPVTKPLTLNYVPTPRHPRCYGMIPISETCMQAFVAFEDPQDGSDYTSEDFGCNIQISGSVSLCCRDDSLHSYSRTISYSDEQTYYTSDGRYIHHSMLGTGISDLDRLVIDSPKEG